MAQQTAPDTVSAAYLAKVLKVTKRRIQQLAEKVFDRNSMTVGVLRSPASGGEQ